MLQKAVDFAPQIRVLSVVDNSPMQGSMEVMIQARYVIGAHIP